MTATKTPMREIIRRFIDERLVSILTDTSLDVFDDVAEEGEIAANVRPLGGCEFAIDLAWPIMRYCGTPMRLTIYVQEADYYIGGVFTEIHGLGKWEREALYDCLSKTMTDVLWLDSGANIRVRSSKLRESMEAAS